MLPNDLIFQNTQRKIAKWSFVAHKNENKNKLLFKYIINTGVFCKQFKYAEAIENCTLL